MVLSIAYAKGQNKGVTVSGSVKDKAGKTALSYVNVLLKTEKDSASFYGSAILYVSFFCFKAETSIIKPDPNSGCPDSLLQNFQPGPGLHLLLP